MFDTFYSKNSTEGFPGGSVVKNCIASTGDAGLILESGRSPGEGNGNPLQSSCLENPMDGGAWQAPVHGVSYSHTFTFTDPINRMLREAEGLLWRLSDKELSVMQEPQEMWVQQERFPGGGHGIPLQYSCLENPMDRRAQ